MSHPDSSDSALNMEAQKADTVDTFTYPADWHADVTDLTRQQDGITADGRWIIDSGAAILCLLARQLMIEVKGTPVEAVAMMGGASGKLAHLIEMKEEHFEKFLESLKGDFGTLVQGRAPEVPNCFQSYDMSSVR